MTWKKQFRAVLIEAPANALNKPLWNKDFTVPAGWIIEFWDPETVTLQAWRIKDGVRDWGHGGFGWAWQRLRESVANRETQEAMDLLTNLPAAER